MLNDDQLDQWFTVLGYGNLDAPVWFVGIEPGTDKYGEQASEGPHPDLLKEKIGDDEVRWDPLPCEKAPEGKSFSLAWKRPIEILQRVWEGHSGNPAEYWERAWQNMMIANLAPLPRKSIRGKLSVDDPKSYYKRVRNERMPMLHRIFMNQQSLRVMIFHGKSAWRSYRVESGFSVDSGDWQSSHITPQMQVFTRQRDWRRLVLTQSMTRYPHFNNAACDALVEKLQEWRVDDGDWKRW